MTILGRCEQDLVGFNPQNSGQVLTIGQETIINNAVVIDTRSVPFYSGTVTLNIAEELGMTAVFVGTNTTTITITALPNQLLYVPIKVTATDCGYDRFGYWQFAIYYESFPNYPANTGGEEPEPCQKPLKSVKVCRFDAKIKGGCFADFKEKRVLVPNEAGTHSTEFFLGYSGQCTGPVTIIFSSNCEAITFNELTEDNLTYTLNMDGTLTVVVAYEYGRTSFPLEFDYDGTEINCFCTINAEITYDNCNNPNLFTDFNNGTMSGYLSQAAFNTAGVLARTSTVFTTTINPVSGTALRATISNPVDYSSRPSPAVPVNPTALLGSIIWQGDIANPTSLSPGQRYWLRCKSRVLSSNHLIQANEEVHLDRFNVAGSSSFDVAIPYFSQYTPADQWHDVGIRWLAGGLQKITPFVRYVNTFASGPFTTLTGDLYLNDGASSDWANVELSIYYPSDCIECPARQMLVVNEDCDYETILDITVGEGEDCIEITLDDNSLFDYVVGHSRSDFNLYRKIVATLPDGNQQTISSVVPYNIFVNPASSDATPPAMLTFPVTEGGYYQFTLCNVPTHDPSIAYAIGDNVVLLDTMGNVRFFNVIKSGTGFTPLVTMGWQTYFEEINENELNEKYCDTKSYLQWCFLDDCINEYLNKLYCSIKEVCTKNICEQECVQNYLYLKSLKYQLDNECELSNVRDIMNYVKKICRTCNCQ